MKLKKAVLLIHGFAGGTYDMESLAWNLEKQFLFDVYQFTLPGHGIKKNCTYHEWVKSVEDKINKLVEYGYNSIYVIGHSMGGVLAAYVASKYPVVKKVVLAAPAFKYIGEWENFSLKKTSAIINDYGLSEVTFRMFEKVPIGAINEFVNLVKKYQECPKKIKVPILILQGMKDDVVPVSSSEYVFDVVDSRKKSLIYLKNSNHDMFNGSQINVINSRIEKFLMFNKINGEKEYL